ncbi:MAG TPA: bifunctional 23S rRNA (guanine(2069)-N(7))-methyltransferase RlmK/23S rRNA (guanine(2445)-N(2))-methyltransferase RlmL [Verrucomicrobiae bacterium]|nr:bifunctional 23S rRNA (guanine(2069)-N(7))-methyltransferase RlmK/23S rRNA (guanine(2445)-N(2))-methyltransferase RlmL [Verrucomicrobiae bacterium]
MTEPLSLFATASRGLEHLLAKELTAFGAATVKEQGGGVSFTGDLAVAYRACLWSRMASRVLLPLSRFPLLDADGLYQAALAIDWTDVFDVKSTFAIEVAGRSAAVTHTHYAGLKVKDAIADTFRAKTGERPDVDTDNAQVRIHLHLDRDHAQIALDLSGESLHRRGYRRSGVEAPLKENLAAAILTRADWPTLAAQGAPLLDPMCGSGTLVIEAALMAADVAPGLARERYGFTAWLDHQPKLWRELRDEAQARAKAGRARALPLLAGSDSDESAIRAALDNARRAGFAEGLTFQLKDVSDARPPASRPGLVVTNPPYGERLGAEAEVIKLHSLLGATLKANFPGWRAAVFTGRPDLGPRIGLRAHEMYSMYNGPLPCKLLLFEVADRSAAVAAVTQGALPSRTVPAAPATPIGGEDFANRLQKNLKHLAKWRKREGVTCYRLYDADLPDYAVAVDIYESDARHVHVQEYQAPKTVDPVKAEKRLRDALVHIQRLLEVPAANLHFKVRRSQKPGAQYGRQDETGRFHEVDEHGCKLGVNLDDYLDTGLFLDHRAIRRRIQQEAAGKRFLNLFCYTASATAHAARGGASQTLSIDMSNTYLDWARRNLQLNGVRTQMFDHPPSHWPAHALLRADCVKWLELASSRAAPQFDLILCDPPTFSHSKKMEGVLDVQRDHPQLIRQCAALLAPGGVLYFSTNRRSFKLDAAALDGLHADDITAQTLDEDFRRLPPPPPHKAWRITWP